MRRDVAPVAYWGLRDYGTATWLGGDEGCDHAMPVSFKSSTLGASSGGRSEETHQRNIEAQATPYRDRCRKCGAVRQDSQLGLEPSPEEYVANMVDVFREVRRVLRADGTCWVNLGDSYNGSGGTGREGGLAKAGTQWHHDLGSRLVAPSLKPKDLVGIPWMVARALQAPYYAGRIAAERDRVWLAAMIDGEGTVCGFDHDRADGGHRSGIHVAITNTSTALLDEAARIWPTSRSEHQRPTAGHLGTKTSWRWLVHGIENKQAVLRELYPYLIAKRQQAVVAYTLLDLMANAKRLGHSPQKDATIAKRAVLTGLLSDLNHQRPVTLPSWLIEPPSMLEPGWYLRSDIIWSKPNPMPESVTDRPTKAHEYLFLLSKSARYYYDADAVREPSRYPDDDRKARSNGAQKRAPTEMVAGIREGSATYSARNLRSVWSIASQPYPGAHFATFPEALVEPCVKAGTSERGVCPECGAPWRRVVERTGERATHGTNGKVVGDEFRGPRQPPAAAGSVLRTGVVGVYETLSWHGTCEHLSNWPAAPVPATVLDPFAGSGTTGRVAQRLGRRAVLIDLNGEYLTQTMKRNADIPLGLETA